MGAPNKGIIAADRVAYRLLYGDDPSVSPNANIRTIMEPCRFIVPGKPLGYKTTTAKSKWSKEFRRYGEYCKYVRFCAMQAGVELPLFASEEFPIMLKTFAYFPNRVHCDPGNVTKGITDALFYDEMSYNLGTRRTKKGDDKYVGQFCPPPRYDKKNPHVVVIIKPYEKPQ